MRISDWSSDVCSSDLRSLVPVCRKERPVEQRRHDEIDEVHGRQRQQRVERRGEQIRSEPADHPDGASGGKLAGMLARLVAFGCGDGLVGHDYRSTTRTRPVSPFMNKEMKQQIGEET